MKVNLDLKYSDLLKQIHDQSPFSPEICIILGSGLGDFAQCIDTEKSIQTLSLIGYPKSTVEGHKGYIHFSKYGGNNLILFQGRIHFYEGYSLSECILPVYIAKKLGCSKIILTNAAGGINSNFVPGDLMLASSFSSIYLKKELTEFIGIAELEEKNKILNLPSSFINDKIRDAAREEKILLKEGVYWYSKGPSYETVAEIRMFRRYGIDAVGMSTVHEAVYSCISGIETASISCITNLAAGMSQHKLSHQEVMETAERVKSKFERLVKRTLLLL